MLTLYFVKEELLKHCRYYGGEESCPFNDPALQWFWDMERVYVQSKGVFSGERVYFNKFVDVSLFPGIPTLLLLIMFTSWGKYIHGLDKASIEGFYDVVRNYLFVPNDHFPEDKIPD